MFSGQLFARWTVFQMGDGKNYRTYAFPSEYLRKSLRHQIFLYHTLWLGLLISSSFFEKIHCRHYPHPQHSTQYLLLSFFNNTCHLWTNMVFVVGRFTCVILFASPNYIIFTSFHLCSGY